MRLKDKVCIITGGGSGIGRGTALLFADEGARLVIADKRNAQAVAAECAGKVERMIAATVARFHRLDVLVNNAGYGIAGTVVETPQEAWDALMATNVRGVFLCSKYAIPIMQRTGGGTIVNTASVVAGDGIRCNAIAPGTIDTPYFNEILKKSTDPEATRKALAARQLLGRLGTAEEIAAGILFLASDESRFATGTILTLDGGMTAQ